MSDKPEAEAKPKKKGGLLIKLLLGVALLGGGAGGAYGMMAAGIIGGGKHEEEDNSPKLVKKGEEDPYKAKTEDKESAGLAEVHGDGGSKYQTTYYSFADEFTSNLKNSDALIQVSLAASTRRDGRVVMWMKKHELAIRSGMLGVLADTPEEHVYTLEGKKHLQKRLTGAINQVLTENEGFGGVDAVYFKTFIIQ